MLKKDSEETIERLRERTHEHQVYVTHDHEEAFDLWTRVLLMEQGRIEWLGAPAEMQKHMRRLPKTE
jgi:ABC-type sulfate/molybdate transport systems ATPase subunit